jgi:hypothetical protein
MNFQSQQHQTGRGSGNPAHNGRTANSNNQISRVVRLISWLLECQAESVPISRLRPEQFRGKARFKRNSRDKKSHIIYVLLNVPQEGTEPQAFLRRTVALVMSGFAQKPTLRTHAKVT